MSEEYDDLRARLRAVDPAPSDPGADSWIDDLVEATMTRDISTEPAGPAGISTQAGGPRRRLLPALAAAAAVAVLAVGGWAVTRGGEDPAPPAAAPTVTRMTVPAADAAGMCIMYSVEELARMQTALDATATAVDGDQVTLEVNRWYAGGARHDDADVVELTASQEPGTLLEGGLTFEAGKRYLLTAWDGVVNICGFSSEWSAEREADFQQAFG